MIPSTVHNRVWSGIHVISALGRYRQRDQKFLITFVRGFKDNLGYMSNLFKKIKIGKWINE